MQQTKPNVEDILAQAVEITSTTERLVFVESACAGDTPMRERVERLIANHFRAGSFLEHPAAIVETTPMPLETEGPGGRIGPYELLEQIGEGGFGVVFLAEQLEPVRRKVALKVIKPGMDTVQVIARFEAERQALAMMDHPNIAKVFDAGTTDMSRPYFVMELVRGIPITEYCDQAQLPFRQRLDLFVQVCRAVQHAHTKGVIHRDLKPSNVLVTSHDGVPVPMVIDFGVAKALGQQLTERTLHTGFTQMIGTPMYMSPEQADFNQLGVDTRSDVYSLGVLLYELLCGVTPFDSERLRAVGFDELRRIIREEEPPRPSARAITLQVARLSTVSEARGADPRKLCQQINGELDWIVMKALEKDRTRRYETASDFAADVERLLKNEPVHACPPSPSYRFRKFARRNQTALVTVAVALSALLVGTGVSVWQLIEANRARTLANERLESERQAHAAVQQRDAVLRVQRYATDMGLAFQAVEGGQMNLAQTLLEQHIPAEEESDRRGFEWHYLWMRCRAENRVLRSPNAEILTAAVSPNERLVASGDRQGFVNIWELPSGRELQTLRYSTQEVTCVRFSPDGTTLATAGQDQTVRLWDTTAWTEQACLRGYERTVTSVAWSPNGKWLATGDRDHRITVWDAATKQMVHSWAGHTDVVQYVAWSPDGKVLASAGKDQVVQLWEPTTWRLVGTLRGATHAVLCLAFSPDSNQIVSSGYYGDILLHDVNTQAEIARINGTGNVYALTFSPNGRNIVSVGGWMKVWERGGEEHEMRLVRSEDIGADAMRAATICQGGETLVTANRVERTIKFWNLPSLAGRRQTLFTADQFAVSAEQGLALTADYLGSFRLRRLDTGQTVQAEHRSTQFGPITKRMPVSAAAFSPDGKRFATCRANRVLVWDTTTTERFHPALDLGAVPTRMHYFAFSRDGKLLAGGDEEDTVWLWDIESNSVKYKFANEFHVTSRLAFSPDGKLIATGNHQNPTVVLWSVATGERLGELRGTQGNRALAFSPDGTILAAGGQLYGVTLWDIATQQVLSQLMGHQGEVEHASFTPDGQTLATMGLDQTVRLWHIPSRRELFTLLRLPYKPTWVQFASNRKLLVGIQVADKGTREILTFDAIAP